MLTFSQVRYLSKIVLGLLSLAAVVIVAAYLPTANLAPIYQTVIVATLLLALFHLLFWARRVLRRCDELQQHLNAKACVAALAFLMVGALGIGLLQLQGYLPLINQLWFFGAALAVWAVALMVADRPMHDGGEE